MSGFWEVAAGETVAQSTTGGSDAQGFGVIPGNTTVIAMITDIKWEEKKNYDDPSKTDRFVQATWNIVDGEHKGRNIYHKLYLSDESEKKRVRHLKVFTAIDLNAGGVLFNARLEPTDEVMQMNLTNKPMSILLMTWQGPDGADKGNWVSKISSRADFKETTPIPLKLGNGGAPGGNGGNSGNGGGFNPKPAPAAGDFDDVNGDIPF